MLYLVQIPTSSSMIHSDSCLEVALEDVRTSRLSPMDLGSLGYQTGNVPLIFLDFACMILLIDLQHQNRVLTQHEGAAAS